MTDPQPEPEHRRLIAAYERLAVRLSGGGFFELRDAVHVCRLHERYLATLRLLRAHGYQRARWLEHNVYYALAAADGYAWVYSEHMNWWTGQVPPGAEEAVRSARRKIRAGQALGFEIEHMVRAAKAKRARSPHAPP